MGYNQTAMMQEQKNIQLANGAIAAQTRVMSLHQQELSALFPQLKNEIHILGLKTKDVKDISQVAYKSEKSFAVPLRDSVVFLPNKIASVTDTLEYKVFQYHDAFYEVNGLAHDGKQWVNISNRDTMIQVVYQHRKHKWLWVFSPKILEQRVYFKNPNAHVFFAQTIKIVK